MIVLRGDKISMCIKVLAVAGILAFLQGACASHKMEGPPGGAATPPSFRCADDRAFIPPFPILEEIPPIPERLTQDEAIRIALRQSPNLEAVFAHIRAAEARIMQAKAPYYPSFDFSAEAGWNKSSSTVPKFSAELDPIGWGKDQDRYRTTGAALSALWVLFDAARRPRLQASESSWLETQRAYEDARRLLILAVEEVFNNVLLVKEFKEVAISDLEFNRTLYDITNERYEMGGATWSDVLNFRIRAEAADSQEVAAEGDLRVALSILTELMGLRATLAIENIRPPEWIDNATKSNANETAEKTLDLLLDWAPNPEEELDHALKYRPDLEALRQSIRTAESVVEEARGGYYPLLTFQAESGIEQYHRHESLRASDYASVRLALLWNFFNGFATRGAVRESQAVLDQRKKELESQWLSVVAEVDQAVAQFESAKKQVQILRGLKKDAGEVRDMINKLYKNGSAPLVRLNEAQADLVNAESGYATAIIDLMLARARLEAATARNIGFYDQVRSESE